MNIVVAYHTNNNGMGTWCLETANALHRAGHKVVLIRAKDVKVTGQTLADVFLYGFNKETNLNLIQKIRWRINVWLYFLLPARPDRSVLPKALPLIKERFFEPDCVLLNISSQLSPGLPIPQLVVAWAWPSHLPGYLAKCKKYQYSNIFNVFINQLNWYKTDNWAYSNANVVLAVSNRLTRQLKAKGINVVTTYPVTADESDANRSTLRTSKKKQLVIAAYSLEEARKRVFWMIEKLLAINNKNWDLTLIGIASPAFIKQVCSLSGNINFTGFLSREALKEKMAAADILMFGSVLDDWGYVQVEAMAQRLAVIAPHQTPCDEIINRPDYLFDPSSEKDFTVKLEMILEKNLFEIEDDKSWFLKRYENLFSPNAFLNSFNTAVKLAVTTRIAE